MRFALIDEQKVEAMPKAKAICPCCAQPVVAKCGSKRIHHWAHQNNKNCDDWWEPETEWHRNWKKKFPNDWQEVVMRDKISEELHIADIRTIHDIVIEFQHSHINSKEQTSREIFYPHLIWVVDGTRLKNDIKRFQKRKHLFSSMMPNVFRVAFADDIFPSAWVNRPVAVIFDFLGIETIENNGVEMPLYCLFPKLEREYIVAEISRNAFIKSVTSGEWLLRFDNFMKKIKDIEKNNERALATLEYLYQKQSKYLGR